ncbi:MAG: nucleotidyltransferase [Firmicutes bacterium]|nr:nucleotidyltransferase [Bacillota bacterium]
MPSIDLSPLALAIASLKRGVDRSIAAPADEELRDAVIQRFEYTMDLSWKLMQRYLRKAGIPESEFRTKRDLFREAARIGLITDPIKWFGYLEARNETSHVYNVEVARAVYEKALLFLDDVTSLLKHLEEGIKDA